MLYLRRFLHDLAELLKAGTGEELADSVGFLLCNPSYNVRRHGESEDTSQEVLGPTDMDSLCNQLKTFIASGGHGHAFCSALQFSSWWRGRVCLTEKKEVANNREGEELEIEEKKVFEVG